MLRDNGLGWPFPNSVFSRRSTSGPRRRHLRDADSSQCSQCILSSPLGRTALAPWDHRRAGAARTGRGSRSCPLAWRMSSSISAFALRSSSTERYVTSRPSGNRTFNVGFPSAWLIGVQVRLQLLNRQSHINFLQTNCGAVSMAPRARTAQGRALGAVVALAAASCDHRRRIAWRLPRAAPAPSARSGHNGRASFKPLAYSACSAAYA